MNGNMPSNKNGLPPGNGKSGPNTRSQDTQIANKRDALTHLKSLAILGDDDAHDTTQGIPTALRRYSGLIKPAMIPQDIRKMMLSLALLVEAIPGAAESSADQIKEIMVKAIEEAKEELKRTVQTEMEKMRAMTEATTSKINENLAGWQNPHTHTPQKPTYSSIAAGMLSTDARLVAQKTIQDRQVLLKIEGTDGVIQHEMDIQTTKKTIQDEIEKLEGIHKIRLVQKTREKGILLEMTTEEGAAWLRNTIKKGQLAQTLGTTLKDRQHNVLVKFVPLAFEEDKEIQEVLEDNNIDPQYFTRARWIKPKHRRRPEQRSGHMVFTFNS